MKRHVVIFSLLLAILGTLVPADCPATNWSTLLQQAQAQPDNASRRNALNNLLENILSSGDQDVEAFYNATQVCILLHEYGLATAYCTKGLALDPHFSPLQQQLTTIQAVLGTHYRVWTLCSRREAWMLAFALLALTVFLYAYTFCAQKKPIYAHSACALFVGWTVWTFGLFFLVPPKAVLQRPCVLYATPNERPQDQTPTPLAEEGAIVRVLRLEQDTGFVFVEYKGTCGFIPIRAIQSIPIPIF